MKVNTVVNMCDMEDLPKARDVSTKESVWRALWRRVFSRRTPNPSAQEELQLVIPDMMKLRALAAELGLPPSCARCTFVNTEATEESHPHTTVHTLLQHFELYEYEPPSGAEFGIAVTLEYSRATGVLVNSSFDKLC